MDPRGARRGRRREAHRRRPQRPRPGPAGAAPAGPTARSAARERTPRRPSACSRCRPGRSSDSPTTRSAPPGVARFLQQQGRRIVPVHPRAETVLGEPGYATLADIPFPVDVVDVFRRSRPRASSPTRRSPSGPRRCGCSSAWSTTRPRAGSRPPASTWSWTPARRSSGRASAHAADRRRPPRGSAAQPLLQRRVLLRHQSGPGPRWNASIRPRRSASWRRRGRARRAARRCAPRPPTRWRPARPRASARSTAASPSRRDVASGTGTPITGSGVTDASMPGRCAAPPAPATITRSPRPAAAAPYSSISRGVRCAETTRTSCGTSNSASACAAGSIVGQSESLPITTPTSSSATVVLPLQRPEPAACHARRRASSTSSAEHRDVPELAAGRTPLP